MADSNDRHDQRRNEIRPVKRRVEDELLSKKNVHGVDIAEKITDGEATGELSIVVYVEEKGGRLAAKDKVPEEIDGIKTDVQVAEVFRPHPALLLQDDVEIHPDEVRYDTLQGGMSIGPCRSIFKEPPEVDTAGNYVFTGTLGCIVTDRTSGDPMMLTNFHVACVDDTWSVGDRISQPSLVDTGSCPTDDVGAIVRAVLSSNVDGAVLSIDSRPTSCEILEIGDITGTATTTDGAAVRKRGRTTGYTHGEVTSVDYTTAIDYGDGIGSVTFYDQIRIAVDSSQSTQFGNSGDSGSVVVDANDKVVGLYFAGTSDGSLGVANPIAVVLDELDVDMCTSGPKLLKEGPKEILKEGLKEWHDEIYKLRPDKWVKEQVKEFKEKELKELKEFGKDWKEYAYEKGDWENTPFDPPVFDNPVRPPVGGRPPFGGRPPLGRFDAARRRSGARPAADAGLVIDFTAMAPSEVPNPVALDGASATVLAWDGTMPTLARIDAWSGTAGLNVDYQTSIVLCSACPKVAVTLEHFSSAPTVEAYDADGTLLDSQTMSSNGPETLVLDGRGAGIRRLVIDAPQNETLLYRVECMDGCGCKPPGEKPPIFEKPPIGEKPPFTEKGFVEGPVRPFIGQDLRPDLRRGALMNEQTGRRAS
ncbi:MAG: hypothetical protein AB8G26_13150 [Ilumatobacter sp.]